MSGGRATIQFKKGRTNRSQAGDLSPISALGEEFTNVFLVECKCYRDLQMIGLYLGLKTGINKHWAETLDDAGKHKKLPLLIAKQNRTPTFICMTKEGVDFFALNKSIKAHFPMLKMYVLWYSEFILLARRP